MLLNALEDAYVEKAVYVSILVLVANASEFPKRNGKNKSDERVSILVLVANASEL